MTIAVGEEIIYSPLASTGHCRGVVRHVRSPDMVDIELTDTGTGETVALRCIAVVPTLKDLTPGTCTADPGESDGKK